MYHARYRYATANNKYMRNHNKDKKSSYVMFWDANNLYQWAMSQKLPVDGFKWVKNKSQFNKDFTKKCNEDSDRGYILEVDVKYPNDLNKLHNNQPFLAERMKIKKCCKLVCNLSNKSRISIKTVCRVIKFNQKAWLKPYIDMNRSKTWFSKRHF